jgi:hypothetical protein
MVGKGSLLVILGFSLIFGIASRYWNRMSNAAIDNFVQYYNWTNAHNIAIGAANIAADSVFWNSQATHLSLSGSFSDGVYTISTQLSGSNIVITSVGRYQGASDTVTVILQPYYFSRFAVYTSVMGGVYWATGDTVWGRYHNEQDKINLLGSPVFYGKVTSKLGTNPMLPSKSATPQFYGGYQSGVSIPMPNTSAADAQAAAASGGFVFNNPGNGPYDVYLTLNSDGTVTYRTPSMARDSTVALRVLAPNGVIFVNQGNLHLKGTLNGQATVGATGSSGLGFGNVYIEDDVLYSRDPQTYPNSTDMLGIVAENNITVRKPSTPPYKHDWTIDAAIFAQKGQFNAYVDNGYPVLGSIKVFGSISNYQLGATAIGDNYGNVIHGYSSDYRFDSRLETATPPSYPSTGRFQVVAWRE